jgi:molecular chaperone GrpE
MENYTNDNHKETNNTSNEHASSNGCGDACGHDHGNDKNIEQLYEELKKENEDLQKELLLALADIQNIRKRFEKEKEELQRFCIGKFSKDLLSVSDNLDRALQTAPLDHSPEWKNFFIGIKMTMEELHKVFGLYSIQKIDCHQKPFDPNMHQAVSEEETNDLQPGIVTKVLQDAYTIHHRLLRPAMVIVSKQKS